MLYMRLIAIVVGGLVVAMGLLWLGQGTGVVLWPAESFMLDERPWAIRGAVLAMVGGIVVWLAWPTKHRRESDRR